MDPLKRMLVEITVNQVSNHVKYLYNVLDNYNEQDAGDMIDRMKYSVQGILLQINHLEELTNKTCIKGKKLKTS